METIGYRPEVATPSEREPVEIHGLGVVIINAKTGEIWAVRERSDKAATGRKRGQLSIPLETRKVGETFEENLKGALAEAFDDVDQNGSEVGSRIQSSLFHMKGNSFYEGNPVAMFGNKIQCDRAIIMHDGSGIPSQPFNALEVGDAQWVPVEAFWQEETRPLARMVMREVVISGSYDQNLAAYRNSPSDRLPMFTQPFSVREVYRRREERRDVGET